MIHNTYLFFFISIKINFYRSTQFNDISYTISSVNCPNVRHHGNGAQILARCAFGEVNDGVAMNHNYLYVACTQGMPDY